MDDMVKVECLPCGADALGPGIDGYGVCADCLAEHAADEFAREVDDAVESALWDAANMSDPRYAERILADAVNAVVGCAAYEPACEGCGRYA